MDIFSKKCSLLCQLFENKSTSFLLSFKFCFQVRLKKVRLQKQKQNKKSGNGKDHRCHTYFMLL